MRTLAEIEACVASLPADDLARLERLVETMLKEKSTTAKRSLLDLEPVSVGEILRPLGSRAEWYDAMTDSRL